MVIFYEGKMRIDLIAAARPNFMKISPIIDAIGANAARGAPLPIHGDGGQKMDFLHVKDAVRACLQLLKQPATGWNQIYNIGSGGPVSVRTLAETCVSLAREKGIGNPSIEWAEDAQAGPSFGMRIEKAGRFLDWRPAIPLRSGLAELMDDSLLSFPKN